MNLIEKWGLVMIILAAGGDRFLGEDPGIYSLILFTIGVSLFFFGGIKR